MKNSLLLRRCRLYDALVADEAVDVLIEDGRIARLGADVPAPGRCRVLEADGRLLAPGLIDVHIQGAGGADVLDGSEEALRTIATTLPRFGTTGFLATTAMHFDRPNTHLAIAAERTGKDLGGAQLLGIHLEGPFINPEKRGGMHLSCIGAPSLDTLRAIQELTGPGLRMMTIAPELEGNLRLIEELAASAVVPSFGHSAANYEQTRAGIEAGIRHVTHLFNAMAPFHHREPGPLAAIAEQEHVSVQLISDGVHVHPAAVRLAWRLLGPARILAITDGIQAIGLPDGRYLYNGKEYESRRGVARYLDGTLIGTAMGLVRLVQRLQQFTGCSLKQAIDAASANPARLLGLEQKGEVAVGKDADLVLLDPNGDVWATIVRGEICFWAEEEHLAA